jgi:signal transduction histidine kinase/CheY-like chemotaxis protein
MSDAPRSPSRFSFARWLRPEKPGGSTRPLRDDQALIDELREDLAARDAALEEARREANEARASRREFLAAMNHELRTPLNAILGFGQVLDMSTLDEDQRDSLRQVLKGGRHLLRLVNELLEISQLDAGNLDLSPEPVGVGEPLAEARDLVQPLAAERGIALDMPGEGDAGQWIQADRHRLKQVLLNLLSNAIKFNYPRGRVAVRVSTPDDTRVRIAVSDTGPGLSPDQVARLFAPFERLEATNDGIEGTGLGLTLCRGLIRRMGGAIGVDSTRGQGATFWVELPSTVEVASPTVMDALPDGARWTTDRLAPGLVLHIEDNSSNLRLIERLLATRPGVRVMAAMQGRLGLDLAREHQPALILLDLNLPDTHGLDVLRRLAGDARTAGIPVVVVTADVTPGQTRRAHALGARAVLAKPLDVAPFLTIVDGLLARKVETSCPRA